MKPKAKPSASRFGVESSEDEVDKNPHPNGWGFAAAQSLRRGGLPSPAERSKTASYIRCSKSPRQAANAHTFIFMVVETCPVIVYNAGILSRPGNWTL